MAIYRPPFIKQLDGSVLGGKNCTVAASCMAAVRHLRGVNPPGSAPWYPTPRYVRSRMGDNVGGTSLTQNDAIFHKLYGIEFDVRFSLPWAGFVTLIKGGRGAVVQGRYSVFHGTRYDASGTFTGNHAVYINEWRYNATKKRNEFLMYDPLADGRRNLYHGPIWIDETTLKKFCGALIISGDTRVGVGKVWAMFTRVTATSAPAPKVDLRFGGTAYRRTLFAKVAGARVRETPSLSAKVHRTLAFEAPFYAYQKTATGALVSGSRVWYGNITGTQWVHSSVVKFTT